MKSFKWIQEPRYVIEALEAGLLFIRELILHNDYQSANEFHGRFLQQFLTNFAKNLKEKINEDDRIKELVEYFLEEKLILGQVLDAWSKTEF